ncbi:MAG: hypothetical protein K0Q94_2818 [Paenibacillus sp.]|jgi:glutathione synthase/RimK-type ligase-like ATP-grasp enzyme|uniref:YheC/YheD family endospore coat-associated protein n=1 Tax=Paenibacillus sp. GCM10012303 TaxID=3317340 RepID=UPI0029EFFB0A|nr:hypothetical protein [Paenibacillus sp.]
MKATTATRISGNTVGIMVCPSAGDPPFSEKQYYRRLSLLGQKLGLAVFVFFPHRIDWERRRVLGYRYNASGSRWEKRLYPLPETVYDRCFYSDAKLYAEFREPIRRLMQTPGTRFLGYGLKGKWSVHQMMIRDEALSPYIPETELLQSPADIERWLEEKGELFLKPHGGSQGKGVLRVTREENGYAVNGRSHRNEAVRSGFRSKRRLLDWIAAFTGGRKYLIQPYLILTTTEGEAFDIRALVQKNRTGRWELTGIAVRRGAPGSVTSNLHGGGHAEEALPFLRQQYGRPAAETIESSVRELALRIPYVLEQYHGRLVELGVDIGVDTAGHVWILEANSKPGRSSFAVLTDKKVRLDSIRNPILYAKFLIDNPGKRHDPSL